MTHAVRLPSPGVAIPGPGIIAFRSRVTEHEVAIDHVGPCNFGLAGPEVRASLSNARSECLHQLDASGPLLRGAFLHFWGGPPPVGPVWAWVVVGRLTSVAACLLSTAALLWFFATDAPLPEPLRPPSTVVTVCSVVVIVIVLLSTPWHELRALAKVAFLSIPWGRLRVVPWKALWNQAQTRRHILRAAQIGICLDFPRCDTIGACVTPAAGGAARRGNLGGWSGGLAAFCAIAKAIHQFGVPVVSGWLAQLLRLMPRWVFSVDLQPDRTFRWLDLSASGMAGKLGAIFAFNSSHPESSLMWAVFSTRDYEDINQAATTRLGLRPLDETRTNFRGRKYFIARLEGAGEPHPRLNLLFCPDLDAFLDFLNPWGRRLLTLRFGALTVAAILLVAGAMSRPLVAEFTVACNPLNVSQPVNTPQSQGVPTEFLQSGGRAKCDIAVQSRGFPGPFNLKVTSNALIRSSGVLRTTGTLAWQPEGPYQEELSVPSRQDRLAFYFQMPALDSVAVTVNVTNGGAKFGEHDIYFKQPS